MRNRPFQLLVVLGCVAAAAILPSTLPLAAEDHAGKELFEKRCTGCHALDSEKAGPRLRGVYGRPAASLPSFPYSDALRKSRITWGNGTLDKWLTDPDAFIPDTDMAFRVPNPEERSAIIAYLKETSRK